MANTSPVLEIAAGRYRADIATFGGGIKALTFDSKPLVETYPDGAYPPLSAGVVLAPWPNRVEDGTYSWQGTNYQLPITEPALNNAIHGFCNEVEWEVSECAPAAVVLRHSIAPQSGWPWQVEVEAVYRLADTGLEVVLSASTPETRPVPFACGLHTYLSACGAPADESRLHLPVTSHHLLNERNLPTGAFDKRSIVDQAIAEVEWDDCFHGPEGLVAEYTCAGQGVRLEMGPGLQWVQLYTPRDYPGRGRALAVEPMSAPPNALHDGVDIATIDSETPVAYRIHLSALETGRTIS
ncbi:aldose 1-epimerase family protein [Corynebacterium flavescens]|uniref:Aldose 1-epimerase n=1 Tax=Corynebacterium flavescens TaxID=28028 RepID=A0A1L7CKH9_CORFL|nr:MULTISPECIES: aldose 1-epimerase family protein [Corynebacterium]APT86273.1 aldose epimerase [Corynebacterium flavescens]KAA8724536.1 aldose 1-epimerase family protein [Corynebacterium flavescens]MDN6099140.1 aldose 1-epimerase family protein [Corynebacterium flavescens]MDN6200491.1 aldose 1-epimerase family protein [Corynebacterium flavescens]MDN6227369.1 aldose 1-epimerase family protein [Corynebacterium flavescens]